MAQHHEANERGLLDAGAAPPLIALLATCAHARASKAAAAGEAYNTPSAPEVKAATALAVLCTQVDSRRVVIAAGALRPLCGLCVLSPNVACQVRARDSQASRIA